MICKLCNTAIYITTEPGTAVEKFYIGADEIHKECYNRWKLGIEPPKEPVTKHIPQIEGYEDEEEPTEEVVVTEIDKTTKKSKVVGTRKRKIKNIKKLTDL